METAIPPLLLYDLESIPRDRPVTLLMRHSARYPITDVALTYEVGLTEEGVRMAEELGEIIGRQFFPGRMMAAPVGRCLDTVEAIARGAGWKGGVYPDNRLSHPFISPAWDLIEHGGLNGVLPVQVRETLNLLLDFVGNGSSGSPARLDIMSTHDTVVGAVVGCLLRAPILGPDWPGFLEGIFLWREDSQVHTRWRGKEDTFHALEI